MLHVIQDNESIGQTKEYYLHVLPDSLVAQKRIGFDPKIGPDNVGWLPVQSVNKGDTTARDVVIHR